MKRDSEENLLYKIGLWLTLWDIFWIIVLFVGGGIAYWLGT